ncbi:MAG: leucyl aminopeptidase [Gammaproteobacteria bacterium]|nr:leucyl aminopeptidase [Gammaproteobacteria bacterium]
MQFEAFLGRAAAQRADCLMVGVFEPAALDAAGLAADRQCGGALAALLGRGDFSGRAAETLLVSPVRGLGSARVLLVGLGPRARHNRRNWRRALSAGLAALARTRVASAVLSVELPAGEELDAPGAARLIPELAGTALYRVNDQKTAKRPRPPALARLKIGPYTRTQLPAVRRALAQGAHAAASAVLARDLGNLPGNICTPRYLAATAVRLGREHRGLKVRVLDAAAIRRLKMGCFLAVTRGSDEPPRFLVLEHRGGRRGAAPVVLVGKGITFDTGGISLKDPAAMDEMKYDMCGAATVLAALDFAARARLRLNVVGLVPTCENMPSGRATKPGDIVTSASGQTVEILNTDAEGRLILCDALHYARRFKPAAVIDIATLTGACIIALGAHHSGVLANDDVLAHELADAGRRVDDRAWQLPLTEDYAEQLKSNFADMANVAGRDGGAITAGAFLGKFTDGLKWAHLDIAGTAWLTGTAKGATARPLPLLAEFLLQRAGA